MKVAICSDIHGNLAALEAVLTAGKKAGVDGFWLVGDLVAHGPRPGPTIRRLRSLDDAGSLQAVRGNTDRYVVAGDLPPLLLALDPAEVPEKERMVAESRAAFAWTRARVEEAGCVEWLAGLPMERRIDLPDGTRALLVHASPGTDDGPGLFPELTDDELRTAGVTATGADLVLVGHTHVPMDRMVDGVRVVNLGSVSVPVTADPRAMWTLLRSEESGWTLEHHRTGYDLDAVLADLHQVGHPSADWLVRKIRQAVPGSPH